MRTTLLLLDSGAFSVWTKGKTIDLEEYISFCESNPDTSYYVNVDVIPGRFRDKKSITPSVIESACEQGWNNYQQMLERLPIAKVIPVFHQNDSFKWLERYLDRGADYVGISPANDSNTTASVAHSGNGFGFASGSQSDSKGLWMEKVYPYIFDGAGRPRVKTHGFAVTSYDLMKFWQWHSVDSASWKLSAAWGGIYVPQRKTDGTRNWSIEPAVIACSPRSPQLDRREDDTRQIFAVAGMEGKNHIDLLTPSTRAYILEFIAEAGVLLGSFVVRQEKEGYKLDSSKGEVWFEKKAFRVQETHEKGVITSFEERCRVNAHFIKGAEKHLPIQNVYFAGDVLPYPLEYRLGKRLMSFHDVREGSRRAAFDRHYAYLRDKR